MTQTELNRAVARATGESVSMVARMGFIPLGPVAVEREPLVVDWDEIHGTAALPMPNRRRKRRYRQ